jgi:hypothetical protein
MPCPPAFAHLAPRLPVCRRRYGLAVRSFPIGNAGVVDFGSALRDSRHPRAPDYLYPILSYLSLRLAILS